MSNRSFCLFFIFFLGTKITLAQKHDYMWALGFEPNKSEYRFFYNFNTDTPSTTIRLDTFSTGLYSASFCDKDGQLLFFSNGQKIFDKNGNLVENGDGLNNTLAEGQPPLSSSYPGGQSGFFLEKPGDPNLVYFISLDFGYHPANKWPYLYVGQNLLVATIDAVANNGAGKVTEKNKILHSGTLMAPAACRHANGRDWWIMVSDADENRHYRVLLTPEGFSTADTQYIGTKPNPIPYDGGNKNNQIAGNCFSSSGKYYADINDQLGFSIFEFDRCSGLLANERRFNYPPPLWNEPNTYINSSGKGAVFSPNDSFFYKTTTHFVTSWAPYGTLPYLFQFDLSNPGLPLIADTINIIDSTVYHFPTNVTWQGFYGAELGPDGRIYIVHSGRDYSTVQYPNIKGRDCKLIHNKPFFGDYIGAAIPCMPNYRLGALDNSPCDTLGLNNIPVANFRVEDTLGLLSRYFYDLSHHEPASWYWNFGDGTVSSERSPLHTYDNAGIYQVCLTVSNQYGSDTYCRTLYLGVSKTDSPIEKGPVFIYPNPFSSQINITPNANLRNPIFRLYDQMGRLIREERISSTNTTIGTMTLPPGIYFWEVRESGRLLKTGKVIKVDN